MKAKQVVFAIIGIIVIIICVRMFEAPNKLGLRVAPTLVPPVIDNSKVEKNDQATSNSPTTDQFIAKFNEATKERGIAWTIQGANIEDLGDHKAFEYALDANTTMVAVIGKKESRIQTISVIGRIADAVDTTSQTMLDPVIEAIDPSLSSEERTKVIQQLHISANASSNELQTDLEQNGVAYSVIENDVVGTIFTASFNGTR
ncbi:hypothetical protein [Paenibacillus sp. SI8]|uniref:hypothetical protein n=1 Tax=unclassified Paenibacillus TaxID=185978 RepID=UPI003467DF96